jgi:hypothetical protein
MSVTVGTVTCRPHPGAGLVARLGGDIFLVVGGDADAQAFLLQVCTDVAAQGGDGRALVRALAGHVTAAGDAMPPCAALAPTGDQMVVFVHGDASVESGDLFKVSGRESLAWVDRVVPWPLASVTAVLAGPQDAAAPAGAFDLRDGAVPGGGFTLVAAGEPASAPAATEASVAAQPAPEPPATAPMAAQPAEPGPPPAAPTPPEAPAAPAPVGDWDSPVPVGSGDRPRAEDVEPPSFESVVIGLHQHDDDAMPDEDLEPRAPLPVAGERQLRDHGDGRPQVRGVYCKNNHFNDARQLFCAVCGINMVQQTPILTHGPRPPLGVLVLDDGSVFQLDEEYVLGREPQHDESVASGQRRPLVLDDDFKTVSRAHARIELHDWDVVLYDNGSANGTFAAAEGETQWQHVPPGVPYPLQAGARVLIGRRTLTYNTHRAS